MLIIKIAAIGDVIAALPLLTSFRKQNPEIKITWVVGKVASSLVAATGLVDRLILIDERKLFCGNLWQKGVEVLGLWKKLSLFSFDLVLTAHPDPRYLWLARGVRKTMHRHFSRKQKPPSPASGACRSREYLRLASLEEDHPLIFPKIQCTLPEHLYDIARKAPIALAPGGAKNLLRDDALRRWPIEYYADLIKRFSKMGIPVAVTGAEEDAWVLPHFSGLEFENLIGKTTLLDLVAFYKRCQLVITHDSGPLHLARVSGCKTLALFGPTNPIEVVAESCDVLFGGKGLKCSPCYDGKAYARCQNNLCMKRIQPQQVVERALMTSITLISSMHRLEEQVDSNPR